jgi:hypothetical protein
MDANPSSLDYTIEVLTTSLQNGPGSALRIPSICSKAQPDLPTAASPVTNELIGSIIVAFVAAILVWITRLVGARKYAPDSPAPAIYTERDFFQFKGGSSESATRRKYAAAYRSARYFPWSMSSTDSDGAIQVFSFTL